jgi:hypothetical protein
VISSAFSWYTVTESPWSTKALWYSGLLFSMAAITTGGVHTAGLHRLGCHPEWHEKLRETLGTPIKGDENRWRPRLLQPIIWQTPNLMLKISITCFLVGLVILIWDIAGSTGVTWMNDDVKARLIGISLVNRTNSHSDCDIFYRCCCNLALSVCYVCIWFVFQNHCLKLICLKKEKYMERYRK